jgi:hypothetical protein
MACRPNTIALKSVALVILAAVQSVYGVPQQAADPTASITAQVVKARDYTTEYVVMAKQSLAKNPSDLQQAQKLYIRAYADYNAWVAYVKTALQDGKAKNLNKDTEYQKLSSDAAASGNMFTAFVDSKTGQPKAVSALLSSLGALGLQLWNGIKDRQQKDRAAAATTFEQTTKWSSWEAITEESLKNQQPPQTTKPSDSAQPSESTQPSKPAKPPKP